MVNSLELCEGWLGAANAGFLEMLAMEMKSEGKYVARGLSFEGAEFTAIECPLTKDQVRLLIIPPLSLHHFASPPASFS